MVVTEIQSGSRALHGFKITPIVVHGRGAGNGIPCLNVPIVVQLRCPPCQHLKLSLSICRGVIIDDVELNYNRRMLIGMLHPRCRWHLSDFSTSSHRAQSDSPPNCITLLYRDIKNHIVGKMQASWCRASCALSSCSKRPAIMSFFFKQSLNKLRCKSLMSVAV